MKAGWKYVDFDKGIQKIPKQKQVKSKDYLTSGMYPIVSQEMELVSGYWDDESFLYKIDKPIVVFGDHTKVIKYVNFDFVVGADGTQLLKPIDQLDTKFFYYFLKSIKLRDLGYARHFKLLKQVPIPLPSLLEQGEIVAYLDKEFALIDALREKATQQLQATKDLFQTQLKQLLTPKQGWEEKKLGEVATSMYRGSGITRAQVKPSGISCVRYGEIYTTYQYAFKECVSHTNELEISPRKYFEHGDLLFAITGESVEDIGKTIAYLGTDKCLAGGDIVVMKHNQNAKYLSYALSTPAAIKQKGAGKTKLKVVHTNVPALQSITIPLPSLLEQEEIVRKLDALSEQCRQLEENYRQTISLCNDLKQAVLRQVFE